jgi:hypothetical protein
MATGASQFRNWQNNEDNISYNICILTTSPCFENIAEYYVSIVMFISIVSFVLKLDFIIFAFNLKENWEIQELNIRINLLKLF